MKGPGPILEISRLAGGYGDYRVLHDVSLTVAEGETVALLGPNGHGKTTLLRVISGLLRPTKGEIRFGGVAIDHVSPAAIVRSGLAHIPQGDLIFPQMLVEENLLAGAYLSWRDRHRRLAELLEILPALRERLRVPARVLSGGERRMLALARGLMCKPRLLMVDEPSLGLAPVVRDDVYAMLKAIAEQGTAMLIVEEKASHLADLADRVCVLESGAVVLEGATSTVLQDSRRLLDAYLG